ETADSPRDSRRAAGIPGDPARGRRYRRSPRGPRRCTVAAADDSSTRPLSRSTTDARRRARVAGARPVSPAARGARCRYPPRCRSRGPRRGQPLRCPGIVLTWGRAVTGDLRAAERREWLCVNGIGGFASGTIAGTPTRRYHALLVAALKPPLGRTVMAASVHEAVEYAGAEWPLFAARWVSGIVDPHGYRLIERFRLGGTTPVWTSACAAALVEKCVWMEHGANTTHVRWRVLRAREPLTLRVKTLVNYR